MNDVATLKGRKNNQNPSSYGHLPSSSQTPTYRTNSRLLSPSQGSGQHNARMDSSKEDHQASTTREVMVNKEVIVNIQEGLLDSIIYL